MNGDVPENRAVARLNELNGWWRLWVLAIIAAVGWGVYRGLDQGQTIGVNGRIFSDIYCVIGTGYSFPNVDEMYRTTIINGCVPVEKLAAAVWQHLWPVLALPPAVFVARWVIKGFSAGTVKE